MPKISILTVAYNIEHTQMIDRVFDSVLRQTCEDFEWIICDDGSTDGTMRIL